MYNEKNKVWKLIMTSDSDCCQQQDDSFIISQIKQTRIPLAHPDKIVVQDVMQNLNVMMQNTEPCVLNRIRHFLETLNEKLATLGKERPENSCLDFQLTN